ncbi:MAG: gamma-glutamylcyclotransferase [Deltaproteobacteria bacterium]|nr:gamma-glutamylcyclotransferase [Deltaproteobacteria bacterium]
MEHILELISENPEERLIVYGSLAPGGPNNFLLARLEGTWIRCVIRGRMGRYRGFKVFRFDPEGEEHQAWLFSSPALPARYPVLDDFEGDEYRRTLIPALVDGQEIQAYIYEGLYFD